MFPETPVNGRREPDDMNEHLRGTWCTLRNGIANDQLGVQRCLERIKYTKSEIVFLKDRIVASFHAIEAIEGIKK